MKKDRIMKILDGFGNPIGQLSVEVEKIKDVKVRESCDKKIEKIMSLLVDIEYETGCWARKEIGS